MKIEIQGVITLQVILTDMMVSKTPIVDLFPKGLKDIKILA